MNTSAFITPESIVLVGVGTILLGLALLLADRRWRARHGNRAAALLILVCVGIGGLALVLGHPALAAGLGTLAAVGSFGCFLRSRLVASLSSTVGRLTSHHLVQAGCLFLMGFGTLLGWVAWESDQCPTWNGSDLPPAMEVAVADPQPSGQEARTDRGGSVPLLVQMTALDQQALEESEKRYMTNTGMLFQVIRMEEPVLGSNCHGWTFTGGLYWISGADVPRILEENGYEAVTQPRVGDVVVYRAAEPATERVLHTGVVKVVGADGLVLIESKWGKMGRFLHRPQNQPYSQNFQYYRSSREGHLLQGLPGQGVPAAKNSTWAPAT